MSVDGRVRPAVVVLIAVWLTACALWIQPGVSRPDGAGYFVYLPSTWLDHDLVFYNEWQRFGMIGHGIIQFKNPTRNGHLGDHWTVGCAVLWYPAYIVAGALRATTSLERFPRNGISLPYNVAAVMTSALMALVALMAGFNAARTRYGDAAALVASIGFWLGSPLLWYALRNGLMAHASSAAVSAIAVLLATRLRDGADRQRLFEFGLAIGVACAVRPQNAPLLLLPFCFASQRSLILRRSWIVITGALLGALPQFVVSTFVDGSPLGFAFVSSSDPGRPWHAFERFWLWEPLFSWFHGLVPWTPFLAVAIAGFFFLLRDDRGLGLAAIYVFVSQWLINAAFERSFWGGLAFGQRRFDSCTIFFILGAAALFARVPRWVAIAIMSPLCAWTLSLFAAASSLDLNRYYTPGELWSAQIAALRSPGWLRPLAFVPATMRWPVLLACVAAILVAMTVLLIPARARMAAASAYLAAISIFFVWCGSHDKVHLTAYRDLIAYNRALGPFAGGAANRVELLIQEERYLRKIGRGADADQTHREIEGLQLSRLPIVK
jgi:hypothetical protein